MCWWIRGQRVMDGFWWKIAPVMPADSRGISERLFFNNLPNRILWNNGIYCIYSTSQFDLLETRLTNHHPSFGSKLEIHRRTLNWCWAALVCTHLQLAQMPEGCNLERASVWKDHEGNTHLPVRANRGTIWHCVQESVMHLENVSCQHGNYWAGSIWITTGSCS